jgi:PAS domain S-box-containing protein
VTTNWMLLVKPQEAPTKREQGKPYAGRSEPGFRELADAMPHLVWVAEPSGEVYWYNKRWYEYTGTTPEAMKGWGWKSVHDPSVLPEVMVRWTLSFLRGQPFEMTFPLRGADGRFRPFLTRVVPVRDAAGEITSWVGTNTDVSREMAMLRELASSRGRLATALTASQRLAAIVESSEDAIVSKDLNGIVTSWNPGAERIFGYTAAEMIGESIRKVIPLELHADEDRFLATIARGERIQNFETSRQTKSGKRIEVSLTISPVRDESGRIVGAAKIARDITLQKEADKALHVSERLATVGRLASTIAHEINNPLEAIMNLVYLARANSAEGETRRLLEQAERELERASLLTKKTLGFYRETKATVARSLGELVAQMIELFRARAESKAVAIEPEIDDNCEIECIPNEIQQLFANLLNNSIDAVESGGRIRVRVSRSRELWGKERAGVRLTVADSGPGIPAIRPRLFDPFFTTKQSVGTGLGLWVCQTIVRKHDGRIAVKSSTIPGRSWTAFSVFLPAKLETIAPQSQP